MIYLDNNATTKVDTEVLNAMLPYLKEEYGNPSSTYSIGKRVKDEITKARNNVAKLLNANPDNIIFTSCGSESNNMILKGIAFANKHKGNHIITTKIEHPAVLNTCSYLEKIGFLFLYYY